jgi:hypothetical protein
VSVIDDDATTVATDPPAARRQGRSVRELSSAVDKAWDNMPFQESHPALLIPGPIELEDDVLKAMGHFRWAPSRR